VGALGVGCEQSRRWSRGAEEWEVEQRSGRCSREVGGGAEEWEVEQE